MRPVAVFAILLIVIGVVALAYGGFNFTTKEKVAEIGPLKIEKDETHSIPLSPVLGVLALVGGVALLVVGRRA
jgi:drug/metabolite transporter (DMT)-like permease